MKTLMILLITGMLAGCAQTLTFQDFLPQAKGDCESSGLKPGTEVYANCVMMLARYQLNSYNAQRQNNRAIWAGALYQGTRGFANSPPVNMPNVYQQYQQYKRQPTQTLCQQSGPGAVLCQNY